MFTFSIDLDKTKAFRYAFSVKLWNIESKRYSKNKNVMLDTGAFNTIINKEFAPLYAKILKGETHVALGGYVGKANYCIIKKMNINGHIIENIGALAVPFDGELKYHVLIGANTINNWKFTISRQENNLSATEQRTNYRYCYNSKGQVMSYQE